VDHLPDSYFPGFCAFCLQTRSEPICLARGVSIHFLKPHTLQPPCRASAEVALRVGRIDDDGLILTEDLGRRGRHVFEWNIDRVRQMFFVVLGRRTDIDKLGASLRHQSLDVFTTNFDWHIDLLTAHNSKLTTP
jgi:hypothetical protein